MYMYIKNVHNTFIISGELLWAIFSVTLNSIRVFFYLGGHLNDIGVCDCVYSLSVDPIFDQDSFCYNPAWPYDQSYIYL